MRSFFLLIISCFVLVACSSTQVTVTPAVTSTVPPPTETPIPTPTTNPEFLTIQTQVAAMGTEVNVGSDGVFYDKAGERIDGISADPNTGEIAIMVNGAEVTIDADKVSITDSGIKINGYAYDNANGDFDEIVAYDIATWNVMDQTARDEALAKLPETSPEGYMRGEFSESDDSLVKYYAPDGKLANIYDITSGEYLTPEAANIAELDLTDGTKWDMAAFWPEQFVGNIEVMDEEGSVRSLSPELQMMNELIKHIISDNVDWGNTEFKLMSQSSQANLNFIARLKKIPNLTPVGAMVFPSEVGINQNEQFIIAYESLQLDGKDVTLIKYYVNEDEMRATIVGVSLEEFRALISQTEMPQADN